MCTRNSLNLETKISQTKILYLLILELIIYSYMLWTQQINSAVMSLRYFRSCFCCASAIMRSPIQFGFMTSTKSTTLQIQFISSPCKMTPHLTCSSNQELGSHFVKYKHMVLICLQTYEPFIVNTNISSNHQFCIELSTQCFTYFSQAYEPFFSCFYFLNSFKILLRLNILT